MQKGKQNEIDIMINLSGRKYSELDEKWKSHIKKMFPEICSDDEIHAYFYEDRKAKPDIVIKVKNREVALSIKVGKNPSYHMENYSDFSHFLSKKGVPGRIMHIMTFYQFGESDKLSNNGVPFTIGEIQIQFKKYIDEVNDYFINHPGIVKDIIYRTIIKGARYNARAIDFFYYGNVHHGFLLSIEDIYREILSNPSKDLKALHFYSLIFQPDGRHLDKNKRLFVRIKWPILATHHQDDKFIKQYS